MTARISRILVALMFFSLAATPADVPSALAGQSHQIANLTRRDDRLRVRDASSRENTPIVLYPHEDWKCMTWKFEKAGDDVRLINYFTHKTLYPAGATDSAVTQHQPSKDAVDSEHWRFIPADDGAYRIEYVPTGKVLSITDDGDVIVEPWTGAPKQKWKLLDKPAHFTG